MIERKGEAERQRQKAFRDKKRADGYVHLQSWVKHEHRNAIKQFIKDLQES